jgi:hydrogenase expression/formation protein HypC
MCLALPVRVLEKAGDEGWVRLGETRMRVNLVMTPDAGVGDWVLVHAGFAIQQVSEEDARETFRIYEQFGGEG